MSRVVTILLTALLGVACAPREYLTPTGLAEIQRRDRGLEMIRVYPSAKFVAVYSRPMGEAHDIGANQGEVRNAYQARRLEVPIPRSVRGAFVGLETREDQTIVWIAFDADCDRRACAYGFLESEDGLYRLFEVPTIARYQPPQLYRKRVSRRKRMQRTKVYARSRTTPVYFTARGLVASVALEIKQRDRVEVEVITVPSVGVPGRRPLRSSPPEASR
ncbi:MAG: hypothetical protein K0V04_25405 [Deltaproteobacteria bacterium]|nr:hypothetical protein [Deltaproteobacteria bacterium]